MISYWNNLLFFFEKINIFKTKIWILKFREYYVNDDEKLSEKLRINAILQTTENATNNKWHDFFKKSVKEKSYNQFVRVINLNKYHNGKVSETKSSIKPKPKNKLAKKRNSNHKRIIQLSIKIKWF